ncbi:MAG: pyridoxamine 5'-phosphate oxidase family protein [Bdellovibrionota bacterium]
MGMSTEPNDIQILAEKISGIRTAMLTTIDRDGVLRSRPMATQEFDLDGRLWFFTKDHSAKVNSIQSDQHVNVAFTDDASKRWVSIAGRARLVRDRKKMQELWTPMLKVWFKDGIDDPELALICVDVESAQYWDSPSGPIMMLAGFAKQLLTGQALAPDQSEKKLDLRH